MINLIGCSKENFLELLKLMDYKHKKTDDDKKDHNLQDKDFFLWGWYNYNNFRSCGGSYA